MNQINFTLNGHVLVPDTELVYKDTFTFKITNTSAFSVYDSYKLTIKPDRQYNVDPLVTIASWTFENSNKTIVGTADLNVDAIKELLGAEPEILVMVDFRDTTSEETYGISHNLRLLNIANRASDSAPTNPDENTYTDDEIDQMLGDVVRYYEQDEEPAEAEMGAIWLQTP